MSLSSSFERSGSILFRYRGQIPAILFLAVIPIIYFTDYSHFTSGLEWSIKTLGIIVCLSGFAIRIITIGTAAPHTSGRNTKEQVAESLNTKGIYSIVRHPLYLGNYLMWAGVTIYVMHFWFFAVVSLLFWIYYERIMFTEERFLEKKFGKDFVEWSQRTPAFIPSFRNYQPGAYPFSTRRVFSKEYSGLLYMVVSFIFVQTLQDVFDHNQLHISTGSIIILLITIVSVLALKFISKKFWKAYRD